MVRSDNEADILSGDDVNSPAPAAAKPVAKLRKPAVSKAKAKTPAAPTAGQYCLPQFGDLAEHQLLCTYCGQTGVLCTVAKRLSVCKVLQLVLSNCVTSKHFDPNLLQ